MSIEGRLNELGLVLPEPKSPAFAYVPVVCEAGLARVIKLTGFVASASGFVNQPRVIDGASNLMLEIFAQAGQHARSAVGVAELPRSVPVEIEFVFALKP